MISLLLKRVCSLLRLVPPFCWLMSTRLRRWLHRMQQQQTAPSLIAILVPARHNQHWHPTQCVLKSRNTPASYPACVIVGFSFKVVRLLAATCLSFLVSAHNIQVLPQALTSVWNSPGLSSSCPSCAFCTHSPTRTPICTSLSSHCWGWAALCARRCSEQMTKRAKLALC